MYVINDSHSAVMVYVTKSYCFDRITPDGVKIKPHHKQTIIVKTGGGFFCNFGATVVYFNINVYDQHLIPYDFPRFEYYKGAGADPFLSILYNPLENLEVINSTTLRIKNY